ncbi:hypothetical protein Kpol_1059p10 [Vanderwaltozyma polyspora DSM 70294]|uniref:Uncharacterized protein n=1 Tax=Vanderwaltozyma polyspora (strain ATCC 22028 / DSM 70294 / BCRC 21397 / CBS 2163 / NBRC 10782 / NRRL Y-8283 / UCD 57-17) TaxID=436907 RepID=A7TN14_VANPO|nr:uncharacterized protein Kpol_1059p10 [Vanderwaltozyma polyspora DSM 70294]EDO16320.1 hypothetical protein Kpol_1059p10 [Vanderwaltozyma polyspora DSM 70294]
MSDDIDYKPLFIALIDETNKPLLIHVPDEKSQDIEKVLKYNVFSNISLDYFDSQLFDTLALETEIMVKLFFKLEGVAVYGMLMKPTGLKIVIGVDEYDEEDEKINDLFNKVKRIYIRVKCNPFVTAETSNDDENHKFTVEKLQTNLSKVFP